MTACTPPASRLAGNGTGNYLFRCLRGHHIRLEVSSNNFPRFDRNSNTGGLIARETCEQYQLAVNRIYHDAAHPSHLILPIIER